MLTVTVRFYITAGGIASILLVLWRIAFILGGFKQSFESHMEQDEKQFESIDKNIRELRQRRR
jgi:hypothetical protein